MFGRCAELARGGSASRSRARWCRHGLLLAVTVACAPSDPRDDQGAGHFAVSVTDDTGVSVALSAPARRIVALVPSATDILVALGAVDRLVGRTNYDTAPEVADLPSVGGGLDPSLETLVALRPDLVVAWAEAGPSTLRSQLAPLGIVVFGLRSQDTSDVFAAIQRLGVLAGREASADALAARIRDDLRAIHASVAHLPTPSVVYLVEHDPPMVAGPATFVAQVIGVAGGRSAFPEVTSLWPQVSLEEIVRRQPEVIVVPALESFTGLRERMRVAPGWRELRAVREGRVVAIPPELVGRPGPQIVAAARVLRDRLHAGGGT